MKFVIPLLFTIAQCTPSHNQSSEDLGASTPKRDRYPLFVCPEQNGKASLAAVYWTGIKEIIAEESASSASLRGRVKKFTPFSNLDQFEFDDNAAFSFPGISTKYVATGLKTNPKGDVWVDVKIDGKIMSFDYKSCKFDAAYKELTAELKPAVAPKPAPKPAAKQQKTTKTLQFQEQILPILSCVDGKQSVGLYSFIGKDGLPGGYHVKINGKMSERFKKLQNPMQFSMSGITTYAFRYENQMMEFEVQSTRVLRAKFGTANLICSSSKVSQQELKSFSPGF